MVNKKILTLSMIVLLVPALACSLGGGSDESASSNVSLGAEATDAPAATQAPVVEDIEKVSEATPTPESTSPETTSLDGSLGLEQLDSFRATMFLEFTGALAGTTGNETTNQRQDYVLEVTRNPQARHQTTAIKGEGGIESDAQSEYYLIDGVTYTLTFGRWIAQAGAMGRSQFANPETFVPIPETATCDSGPEDINGISAIHCTFTEADNIANALNASSAQGDIWFAEAGNYVVKYELDAQDVSLKGRFAESGGYYEFATYTIGYELEEVDGGLTISLPAEAEGAEVVDQSGSVIGNSGLAAPDGADVFVDSDPGGLNYYSTEDQATLIDFHRQALPAAGWQADPEESYVDDNYALLIFENETGILRVFIQKDIDGGNFVSVTLPFVAPGPDAGAGGDTSTGGGAAAGDIPVLDDATELFSGGAATTYVTEADIETVVEFYRQELSAAGWTEDTSSSISTGDVAVLKFEQDGTSLTASATKEDDGRVRVSILKQ